MLKFGLEHLYRLLLVFSSISLTFAIFLVNKGVSLFSLGNAWALKSLPGMPLICRRPPEALLEAASYLCYFLGCFLLSKFALYATRWLSKERVDESSYKAIELTTDTFLPIYLTYFFVALSATSYLSFAMVFGVILIFVYRSEGTYFDPMYVLRGYKIYAATSSKGVKVNIITQKTLKGVADLSFNDLRRINEFTFIEVGGGK
ncbi:hypothetical protein [Stakelama marina]|uniref:Uncharacterized protein n=1 Tax=Stakelama marina TaxID=2826939 RepID=A0A8T4I9M6_9SPHN|nr:hypothetical protein [Stakelama marina]MBR0551053.1 hypothetical protein [Stakelama marina]